MLGKLKFTATIHDPIGVELRIEVLGGEAWALLGLVEAGALGCTPVDNPTPRWSHYVWLLRGRGLKVDTISENHAGPFAGSHACCVLRSRVTVVGGNLQEGRPNGVRYPAANRAAVSVAMDSALDTVAGSY